MDKNGFIQISSILLFELLITVTPRKVISTSSSLRYVLNLSYTTMIF